MEEMREAAIACLTKAFNGSDVFLRMSCKRPCRFYRCCRRRRKLGLRSMTPPRAAGLRSVQRRIR